MTAHELVNRLGQVLGIEVSLNEDNVCRIIFDDDAVDFEVDKNIFAFIGEVGPVPSANRESWYQQLLAGNFLGQETGKATLGLDSNQNVVCLHQFLDLPVDYPEFEAQLERFVTILRSWKSRFRDLQIMEESGSVESGLSMTTTAIRV